MGRRSTKNKYGLTPKMMRMFPLLANGRSNEQIAIEFGLKPRTAEQYRTEMIRILGLNNSAHLISWAYEHGVLRVAELDQHTETFKAQIR